MINMSPRAVRGRQRSSERLRAVAAARLVIAWAALPVPLRITVMGVPRIGMVRIVVMLGKGSVLLIAFVVVVEGTRMTRLAVLPVLSIADVAETKGLP